MDGRSAFAEVVVYESGERDPFVSLLVAKREGGAAFDGFEFVEGIEDIRLEGVVVDPRKGSYVVANGDVLAEGETRNFVRIAEIREDGVVFEINGKKYFKPFPAETTDAQ